MLLDKISMLIFRHTVCLHCCKALISKQSENRDTHEKNIFIGLTVNKIFVQIIKDKKRTCWFFKFYLLQCLRHTALFTSANGFCFSLSKNNNNRFLTDLCCIIVHLLTGWLHMFFFVFFCIVQFSQNLCERWMAVFTWWWSSSCLWPLASLWSVYFSVFSMHGRFPTRALRATKDSTFGT